MTALLGMVGRRLESVDALPKVRGDPIYTEDMKPPNSLFVKVVRSTVPHARILNLDVSRAITYPGVHLVLTAADILGSNDVNVAYYYGQKVVPPFALPPKPLLCSDKVRQIGDPIAAIAAEDSETAENAATLVKVDYEPLPAYFSPFDAMKPGSARIHEDLPSNVANKLIVRKGDVEKGFRESDVIIENEFKVSWQEHAAMEPDCGFAVPEPDGSIRVVGSLQSPHGVLESVCRVLAVTPDRVSIVQAQTGGGFGEKGDEIPNEIAALTALVAMKTKRPASLLLSREESVIAHSKRHPYVIRHKTGVKKDGTLVAAQIELISDTGAYPSLGPGQNRSVTHATGPYVIPNVKTNLYYVYTNNPYSGAMRGFANVQPHFAFESQMDEIAEQLGMDPVEFRLKNILRPGSITATAQKLDSSVGLEECISKVVDAVQWNRKRSTHKNENDGLRRGVGIALLWHGNALGRTASAALKIHRDGTATLYSGMAEFGNGSRMAQLMITSETLGLPSEKIHLEIPNTRTCPDGGPTTGSRGTTTGGQAARLAALKLRTALVDVASEMLGCNKDRIEIGAGVASSKDNPSQRVSIYGVIERCYQKGLDLHAQATYIPPKTTYDGRVTGQGIPYYQYTFGAVVAEVEVDPGTGYTRVTKITGAYDCGKIINPYSLEGQIDGATIQGLGYALSEEVMMRDGAIINPNLADYFIPTSLDIPEMNFMLVEYPSQYGAFGSKAMGEPAIDAVAPAIANAVKHAIGVRITELPITPEKVLLGSIANRKAAS